MDTVTQEFNKDLLNLDQLNKWKGMLQTLAQVLVIPFAGILIPKEPNPKIIASWPPPEAFPYSGDHTDILFHYCKRTLKEKCKVFIPNAFQDPIWAIQASAHNNNIAYLGLPLFWPDGRLFGVLCIQDDKEKFFVINAEKLLLQGKEQIESHLNGLTKDKVIEQLMGEKQVATKRLNQLHSFLECQKEVLNKLASGKPLGEIFDYLTLGAEGFVENAFASILLLDNCGTRLIDGSTPSFSKEVKDAFNGLVIGPLAGSCGTAAYTKELVIVEDISTDPRWEAFKDFAQTQGLKSCFSAPILDSKERVLGTFALTFSKKQPATELELEIVQCCAYVAGVAIELKRSEENLSKYSSELEDFTLVASHDLQEPLRKIITFGDMIAAKLGDADEITLDYLARMRKTAEAMKVLIEDLLAYSRLGVRDQLFQSVDLNMVVKNVLNGLETRIARSQGSVAIKTLPKLEADPTQMHQLFQNLIGNALKYSREGVPPEVILDSSMDGNGEWAISIEDNGIGIDEQYIDKIFKPFQRLHNRMEYEGTGLGLTICNKIIVRHGGKMTVKNRSPHGTKFQIYLPEKQGAPL